jgi:hypothetical protein
MLFQLRGCPISRLGFGEMWEITALDPEVLKRNQHSDASIR